MKPIKTRKTIKPIKPKKPMTPAQAHTKKLRDNVEKAEQAVRNYKKIRRFNKSSLDKKS